jgi:GT2 family glycosyltransferase
MDVSIIIVNFNTKELTQQCLASIFEHTKDIEYEVIVVDNASVDGSQNMIKKEFPNVLLIESSVNLGFGRGNNLGAERAQGSYLFFLNSDTLLVENSIKKMLEFFINNEGRLKIGSLGCLLVDKDNNINGMGDELPMCRSEIQKYLNRLPVLRYFYPKRIDKYPLNDIFFEIGYVIGADLMISKNIFNSLGGFSPDFFMYYEESDLQARMRKSGLISGIYTQTQIIHLEDQSGTQIKGYNNKKRIINHLSRNLYLKRNDSDNYNIYKKVDRFILKFNMLNKKYTSQENKEYIDTILKSY